MRSLTKVILISVFSFICLPNLTLAQALDTLWTKIYGGDGQDGGNAVLETSDQGYVILGQTSSFGAGERDIYLIRTNALGNIIWSKTYGGSENDRGYSLVPTQDGGFVIVGITSSYGNGNSDVYLIRTNEIGDTLWTKTYGDTSENYGNSIQMTADGGYIIAGSTETTENGDNVYLLKTNSNGELLWTRNYGGTDDDYGNSVKQLADGGFIIAGETRSFGAGNYDAYLIRTDSNGDTIWTKTFGGW